MSKKIKSYYFKHDCYAHEDDKLVELRMTEGAAGYGVYFLLLELLSTAAGGILERNYKRIAYIIREDEADVAEASDLNYKMQLALYDKLGNTLWDTKKYLYLMNCIYGLSDSRTYEIKK